MLLLTMYGLYCLTQQYNTLVKRSFVLARMEGTGGGSVRDIKRDRNFEILLYYINKHGVLLTALFKLALTRKSPKFGFFCLQLISHMMAIDATRSFLYTLKTC